LSNAFSRYCRAEPGTHLRLRKSCVKIGNGRYRRRCTAGTDATVDMASFREASSARNWAKGEVDVV
jgi:hypothetical protein